jgi:ankyrin repeat protein
MKKVYTFSFLFLSLFSFGQAKVFDIARNGTIQQMDSLYQLDPNVITAKSNEGFTPMILAAYKNNLEIVDYLIQKNIELNISSPMGTPLMAAVVKNNAEIVLKLLKAKADPNITDANGSTALHYAVLFKLYDLIPLLINYQANVDALDNNKKSPKMFAIDTKDEKLITLFK